MAARIVAENLIKSYGRAGLARLIELFRSHTSGTIIAAEFEVSRQRVYQWRVRLGQESVLFTPDPEISDLIDATTPGRTVI